MATAYVNVNVRYEPDENPPRLVTIGSGFQAAMVIVAPVVLTVVIVARIAEQAESYISWAVIAALVVSGATTILQAVRVGRIGAGHVLSASEGENIEDKLAYMGETPEIQDGREISFRLLRHYASSVRHQKYHGVDIVTVRVEGAR